MVRRLVSRYYKISLLIVAFIILDFFIIVCSNMLIDGNNFVLNEGEYTYPGLFYSQTSDKEYYTFSRGYYDKEKYITIDKDLKGLKFKAVNEFKSMTILSFIPRSNILGYFIISDANLTDEEIKDVYDNKDFVYYGYIYEAFGKMYMYVLFKDYIYTVDNTLLHEDNFYLATNSNNSKSVAFLEVEGLDLSVIKQGNEQKTLYRKGFVSVYNKPYEFIIITILLIEIAILCLSIRRARTGKHRGRLA